MNRTRALAVPVLSLLLAGIAPRLLAAAPPSKADQQPTADQPPADPESAVEGPAPLPEVPQFDDPLVAALQAQPGGLTSDEVARRAVEASPTIASKQAELEIAKAQLDQTIYQFIPQVTASFTYTRLSQAQLNFGGDTEGFIVGALNEGPLSFGPCSPGSIFQCVIDTGGMPVGAFPLDFGLEDPPLNSFSLQAQLNVPISDYIARLPTAKKASEAQIQAAELARDAERLTVERDARIAYYDWVRGIATVVSFEESLERTQARLEDAQASFDAGVASRADVMRLDAAVATLTAAKIRAQAYQELAAQRLALLMGEEGFPSYTLGEDVLAEDPLLSDTDDLQKLISEAQDERLEVKALRSSSEALDQGIKTTRAGYYPRLDGFAEATYSNPNQRFFPLEPVWNGSWSAGLRLSFSLDRALLTSAEIDEYEATRRQLETQELLLQRGVALEVAVAWAERASAEAELEYFVRAAESAAEGYRVAVDLFQVGDATTTDILDAEYDRVAASLRAINTKIDLRLANLRLLYATGRLEPILTESAPGSKLPKSTAEREGRSP